MEEVYSIGDIDPWGHDEETSEDYEYESVSIDDSVRFPYDPYLNSKISLWMGDLCNLSVGAIVNTTDESMTVNQGISKEILKRGGPELMQEIRRSDNCRTGEVRVTSGYNLPASYVIHTVGPRYNEKYRTAAENALHSCYRNSLQVVKEENMRSIGFCIINSQKRGYPSDNGAHIAIRTVRRFLEHWGDDVDRIIFAMPSGNDLRIYAKILPLYFPRSEREENIAKEELPRDVGNEFGETVVEERKIRIQAFPSYSAYQMYYSPFDKPMGLYSYMKGDHDAVKKNRLKAIKPMLEKQDIYEGYLRTAKQTDLSDIARLNLIFQSGVDHSGRSIIVVVGFRFPEGRHLLDRVYLHIIKTLDKIVDKEYIIVYLHSDMEERPKPEMSWLNEKLYRQLHEKYSTNLRAIYILHPTFWLKIVKGFFSTFADDSFWDKVRYIERVSDLYDIFDRSQLRLPDEITAFDEKLHGKSNPARRSNQRSNAEDVVNDL
eukprot:TRINITY_DN6084_c0_g1_i1.p1 TRINITY_DN6084_c0_g1~~TRINITY_DN6084_c0_g1_i1.p1  ORF type:complete len:488 (-),score=99.54 TRINITY_DN6084_c0_g1_i1:38-1501(-)